jgi:hypothetical protein
VEFEAHISITDDEGGDDDEVSVEDAMEGLHKDAERIAKIIQQRIRDRSPDDTGAMKEDETYKVFGEGEQLVTWYAGSYNQETENHRYYLPYQEGPPMGLKTYTNEPHRMFERVTTEDPGLIEDWAYQVIEKVRLQNKLKKALEKALEEGMG